MQHRLPILFEKIPEDAFRWEKFFSVENIQVIAEGVLVNCFLQLEQYVFCVTITDSQSLAL